PVRNLEEWKGLRGDLNEQPGYDSVRNCHLVNIAPLQLSKEVLWIQSAHLDEALVTAALYLDARDLKSACDIQTNRVKARRWSAAKPVTSICSRLHLDSWKGVRKQRLLIPSQQFTIFHSDSEPCDA